MKTVGKGLGPDRQLAVRVARREVKEAERLVRNVNDQLSDAVSALKDSRARLARMQIAAERNPS